MALVIPATTRAFARAIHVLAVLAMTLVMLGPTGQSAWQCEGRQCGVTAWVCCCVSPSEFTLPCEITCGSDRDLAHLDPSSGNPGECHCTPSANDTVRFQTQSPHILAIPVLAVDTQVKEPAYGLPLTVDIPQGPETRGPPTGIELYAARSLRAPPVA